MNKTPKAGDRFGRWVVLGDFLRRGGRSTLVCQCECGTVKRVGVQMLHVGTSRSCGCLSSELTAARNHRHGAHGWPEYRIWSQMKSRCNNPRQEEHKNYGGRGIYVCEDWSKSFQDFIRDVGRRPNPRMTLERIDNNGPYASGNVRWAPLAEQARNKRSNRIIEFNGKAMCLSDWAANLGTTASVLRARLSRHGWSVSRALTAPVEPVGSFMKYRAKRALDGRVVGADLLG